MFVYSILLVSLVAFASCQYQKSSKEAAILNEARYFQGGQFGAAYKQDDGIEFKEETDPQGNRVGAYTYLDPTGVRRTVTYTAGKDGFKASGDHLPAAPAPAPAAPSYQAPAAPSYQAPSYQAPVAQSAPAPGSAEYNHKYDFEGQYNPKYDLEAQYDPNTENEGSPQANQNGYQQSYFAPAQNQYNAAPAQPSYNPVQFSFQSPQYSDYNQYSGQASFTNQYTTASPSGSYKSQYEPLYKSHFNGGSQSNNQGSYVSQYSTEVPSRQAFPGKLSLNRSPDGYSYTFNSV